MANQSDDLRPAPDLVTDGVPATSENPSGLQAETVEGEPAPLDHPQGVDEWGTTAAEGLVDEPLDLRVLREEPQVDESYLGLADDGVVADDALSAEEAALRVEEEPPGLSYAPDPGYLSEDDE